MIAVNSLIPEYNEFNILPPRINGMDVAYECSIEEFVSRFCTTPERAELLKGFNAYRLHLLNGGFTDGYQWVNGSFVQDCEALRNRAPNDIDIVTFNYLPKQYQMMDVYDLNRNAAYYFGDKMKERFHCDTHFVDLSFKASRVDASKEYWKYEFGRTRDHDLSVSKGFIQLNLMRDRNEYNMVQNMIRSTSNG